MAFTKVVGAGIHTLSNITSHNINSSGIITATKFVGPIEGDITAVDATFTGNVSIAKTLTYEDVKNVDSVGIGTFREGIFIPDNKKAQFGNVAGTADFEIAHDTNNTVLQNRTGALYLKGIGGSGNNIIIEAKNNDNSARFIPDGAVELYHSGNQKIQTTSHGISVTGIGTFSDAVRIVKTSGPLLELTTNTGAADATLRLSEGTPGSTTNGGGMFYSGADNKLYITCGTDLTTKRITINRNDGKVGIGTVNPTSLLTVGARPKVTSADATVLISPASGNATLTLRGGNPTIYFDKTGSSHGKILTDAVDLAIYNGTIDSEGSERLRIKSSGAVGIGTNAYGTIDPQAQLHVSSYSPTTTITTFNHLRDASQILCQTSNNVNDSRSGITFTGALHPTDGCSAGIIANHENVAENSETTSLSFYTSHNETLGERLRIKSAGTIAITGQGANNANPRVLIEDSTGGSNDFSVSQYEDSNGTYTLIGQNVQLLANGNETILDSNHKTASIYLDARNNGGIFFSTGGTNTHTEKVRITSDGALGIGNLQTAQSTSTTHTSKTKFYIDSTKFTKVARLAAGNISSAGWFTVAKIASSNGNHFKCYASIGGDFTQDMCIMELTGAFSASGALQNTYAEPVFKAHRVGAHSTDRITRARFVKDSSNVTYLQIYIASGHSSYWGKSVLEYTMGAYAQNIADSGSAAMFEAQASGLTGIRTLEIDDNAICVSAGSHKFYSGGNATERLTIDSDGRMLLGTIIPGNSTADDLTIATSSNTGITIRSGTNGEGNIFFGDNTSGADQYRGMVRYYHNGDALAFHAAGSERLRISNAGTASFKGGGAVFEQIETTNPYNSSWTQANGKIVLKGDLSGGNYFGWRQKSTASGSVTQANAEKKLPTLNDFTYPNSSNGMLIASTSKIGFSASAESPQYANGVTMLFDSSGLAIGNNNAFDCSDSVSSVTSAKIKLLGSGKVLIGTTDTLHSSGENLIVGSGSGEEGMSIYSGTSSAGVINFADGDSGSDRYDGRITYNHGTSPYMRFHVQGGTERLKLWSQQTYGASDYADTGTGNRNYATQAHPTGVLEWQTNTGNGINKYNCYIQATPGDSTDMYITIRNSGFYRITVKASHNSTQADVAVFLVYGLNSRVAANRITTVHNTGSFAISNHNTHVNAYDSTVKISYSTSCNQGLRALVETIGGF